MHTISNAARAFFRTANDTNASTNEREAASKRLHAYCAKHSVTLADIVASVEADSLTASERLRRAVKPSKPASDASTDAHKRANADTAAKPGNGAKREAPRADKPEKPSKPAAGGTDYDKRVALVGELRNLVAGLYNGPSLAVRSNAKRVAAATYSDLLATPKHRTTLAKLSVRDESALFLILKRGERNGSFDPVFLNLDAGIFSRLASVGFIASDGPGAFLLTPDALAHARKAAKRAA